MQMRLNKDRVYGDGYIPARGRFSVECRRVHCVMGMRVSGARGSMDLWGWRMDGCGLVYAGRLVSRELACAGRYRSALSALAKAGSLVNVLKAVKSSRTLPY